jgi:hypothetical protein
MDFSNCENQESLVDGSGMDGSLYFHEINKYDTFIKKQSLVAKCLYDFSKLQTSMIFPLRKSTVSYSKIFI